MHEENSTFSVPMTVDPEVETLSPLEMKRTLVDACLEFTMQSIDGWDFLAQRFTSGELYQLKSAYRLAIQARGGSGS